MSERSYHGATSHSLSSGCNKDRLVKYYCGFVQENASLVLQDSEVLYITQDEGVINVVIDNVLMEALQSNHEEVDTRMLLHVACATDIGTNSVIVCPDYDALVLLKHHGARCSSVVRAFAHGAMGHRIDPSWGGPTVLFLVPASAPRLV